MIGLLTLTLITFYPIVHIADLFYPRGGVALGWIDAGRLLAVYHIRNSDKEEEDEESRNDYVECHLEKWSVTSIKDRSKNSQHAIPRQPKSPNIFDCQSLQPLWLPNKIRSKRSILRLSHLPRCPSLGLFDPISNYNVATSIYSCYTPVHKPNSSLYINKVSVFGMKSQDMYLYVRYAQDPEIWNFLCC